MRHLAPLILLLALAAPTSAHAELKQWPSPQFTDQQKQAMQTAGLKAWLDTSMVMEVARRCPMLAKMHTLALELSQVDAYHKLVFADASPKPHLGKVSEAAAGFSCAQAAPNNEALYQRAKQAFLEWLMVADAWAQRSRDVRRLTEAELKAIADLAASAEVELAKMPGYDPARMKQQTTYLAEAMLAMHRFNYGGASGWQGAPTPQVKTWLIELDHGVARLVDGIRQRQAIDLDLLVRPSIDTEWVAYSSKSKAPAPWLASQDTGCHTGLPYRGIMDCPLRVIVGQDRRVYTLTGTFVGGGQDGRVATEDLKRWTPETTAVTLLLPKADARAMDHYPWRMPDDDTWSVSFQASEAPGDRIVGTKVALPPMPGGIGGNPKEAWVFPKGTLERLLAIPDINGFRIEAQVANREKYPVLPLTVTARGLADALAWASAGAK